MVPVVLVHEDVSYNSLKTKHMSFSMIIKMQVNRSLETDGEISACTSASFLSSVLIFDIS